VDVLGEFTNDAEDAAATVRLYREVLDALAEHDLDSGVSVKLTAIGLDVDQELCRGNLEEIIEYAAERNRFVRVDMEDSPHTSAVLGMVLEMHERHENVGAVVQAYLRRSLGDVEKLVGAGETARLCKGIYDEPREVAYKGFDTVRQSFVVLLEEFMKAGVYVGVATHDEHLVFHALRLIRKYGVPKDRYEFQMLLGVDEQLRRILVRDGHKVRVYVPFGQDWYAYSSRRLKENPKIARYVAQDVIGSVLGVIGRNGSAKNKK
jgi:proline dehydrogenase